jgi:hypothetical protein
MSRSDEKDTRASQTQNSTAESTKGNKRPGMPNKASVVSEKTFISPKGKRYRLIRTDEMDPYDAPVPPEEQRSKKH